jgi:hypothetical protein
MRGFRRWSEFRPNWRALAVGSLAGLASAAFAYEAMRYRSLTAPIVRLLAAAGCGVGQAVGAEPSIRGERGYWRHLDRDGDGIACEPWGEGARRTRHSAAQTRPRLAVATATTPLRNRIEAATTRSSAFRVE